MSLDFLKKAVHLLVLWTAINLLRSCLTGMSQGDPDSDDGVSSTQEENQNQTNKKQTDGKKNARLPFPKKPTRHSTRVMLLAQPQPPTTQISSCIEQINSIGENAQSQEEMVISRNQLVPLVESNQDRKSVV